jgi:uncharacterized protein (TIGR03086 family)
MSAISDRYAKLAAAFTATADSVPPGDPRWSQPSPCAGWDAAGVVAHMVDTHRLFLGFIELELPEGAGWPEARDAVHAALADEATAGRYHEGMFGTQRWDASVDRFVNPDLLLRRWDLARALGVDDTLDPHEVHAVFETAKGYPSDLMRTNGVFGPEVPLPDDASEQDRLLAFTGRDPRRGGG